MVIHWFGQGCVRIRAREGTVVIDPLGEGFGLKSPKLKADIVFITHQHADHNNLKAIEGKPFVIQSAGEYHVKDIFSIGVPAYHDAKEGQERGSVVTFVMTLEGLNLAHLSDIGQVELTPSQLEALGNVDVLLVPVGGVYTVGAAEASRIVNQIEPKVVIPVHYDVPGLKIGGKEHALKGVEPFLDELGVKAESLGEAKITSASLPQEGMQVIALNIAS